MEKVILTPKAVSAITGMSLDYCIKQICGTTPDEGAHKYDIKIRDKMIERARKKLAAYEFILTEEIKILNPNAVSDDIKNVYLLHEAIRQNNQYFDRFLMKICKSKSCIDAVDFRGDFKYYDKILSPEHIEATLRKLKELNQSNQ